MFTNKDIKQVIQKPCTAPKKLDLKISRLEVGVFMSKYSFEFKKKVVLAYLNEEGGYKALSKKYGISAKSNFVQWVHNY